MPLYLFDKENQYYGRLAELPLAPRKVPIPTNVKLGSKELGY
jgi:hypothetical protein